MRPEELSVQIYDLSYVAGMNQRYHQERWTLFRRWDIAIRIIVALFAALTAIFSLLSVISSLDYLLGWSIGFSILSLATAVTLNIAPLSSQITHHHGLLINWGDLRADIDVLSNECNTLKNGSDSSRALSVDRLESQYHNLLSRKNRLNVLEFAPNKSLLEKAYEAEGRSRLGDKEYDRKKGTDSSLSEKLVAKT